uniref:Tyrosine-protein kinase n=1 Tax=Haemonchus contortus TaxID=6289 RepID=A0A7I4YTE0_HAECO
MPGESDSLESTIGKGHLSEPTPTTTSIRSIHSAGDSFTHPADFWLQSADFYHGYLPREDIPPLLLKNGDFLVRLSEAHVKTPSKKKRTKAKSRVISVLVDPQSKNGLIPLEKRSSLIKNIVIMHKNKKWWIDPATQFDKLVSLFEHYQTKPLQLDKDAVLLKRGVGLCRWEFKHANVQVGRLLGRGAYGEVRKGTVIRKNGQIVNVAVKTLTMTNLLSRELIREIMKEARIMRDLHHVNVVNMIGVVLVDHPIYILLEYVSGGALDVYLRRKHARIGRMERFSIMLGVASGMDYIHKANIIHRDLAARNCLYDRTHTVKISDFGLSRPGAQYKMKTAQKMPIKWMAPESILTFTFTRKTDIYTYGVLIYEIFAGIGPYDDMRNSVVKKMIVEGKVNEFPASTPDYVVNYVKEKLWCKDPDKRPDFSAIKSDIEKIISAHPEKDLVDDRSIATQAVSEGKTTATIEIDVACDPKIGPTPSPSNERLKGTAESVLPVDGGVKKEMISMTSSKDQKSMIVGPVTPVPIVENKTMEEVLGPESEEKKGITTKPKISSKESPQKSGSDVGSPSTATKEGTKAPKTTKDSPSKGEKDKDSAKKGRAEDVTMTTQIDLDSRREKDDFKDVEIRTKPVFGRRSKLAKK